MKLIDLTRKQTGLKNYGIAKWLREQGIPITVQAIDAYEKPAAKSMRLDILVGLEELNCKAHGLAHSTFWRWVRDDAKRRAAAKD